jgi:penicillin-binding protein 1A
VSRLSSARILLIVPAAGAFLAVGVAALAVQVADIVRHGALSTPVPVTDINVPLSERSTIYAADGSVLAVLHGTENRTPISIDQVPEDVINAVVDVEDARFFTHGAVDLKSTVRALASNVNAGGVREGGSTITQQLVKNIFLSPKRNLSRKIKEAFIADRVERTYTKQQILQAYLNTIYFGNGSYGIEAAAETYFGTTVGQVTPAQAAFLAGVISNPVGYDPILNPQASRDRRNYALDRMAHYGHLTQQQADALKQTPLPTVIHPPQGTTDTKNDYYVEQVKQILLNQSTTLGTTYSERYNALFGGGLKIYTNLDPRLQSLAESTVANDIPANSQGFTGALASVVPSSGQVKAIVGGPGFDVYQYDLATQAFRQPGSGFKLFTMLAAYEAGDGLNDTVNGSSPCAVDFPTDHDLLTNPIHNDEGQAIGPISVTQATADSVNCAFIRLAHQVGLPAVINMAHRLGLSEAFPQFPSMVIGGANGVTVLQMANAYATLADDGVYHPPSFIDHIIDRNGATIYQSNYSGTRVLSPQISRMAVQTLSAVVQSGTGTAAALPDRPVVGKTGTTSQNTNAWFNGITPQLATSVWMGDPKGNTPMYDVGGITVFGGTYPAHIWHDYTEAALQGQPAMAFPAPDPSLIRGSTYIPSPDDQSSLANGANGSTTPSTQYRNLPTSTSTRRPVPTSVTPPSISVPFPTTVPSPPVTVPTPGSSVPGGRNG